MTRHAKDTGAAPMAVALLQAEGGAPASQPALGHDGDSVREQICLVHEVRGQQHGAPFLVPGQHRPQSSPGRCIHA